MSSFLFSIQTSTTAYYFLLYYFLKIPTHYVLYDSLQSPLIFYKEPKSPILHKFHVFYVIFFLQQVIQPMCPSVLQRHFYMEAAVLCFYQWWCSYLSVKLVSSMPTPLSETLQKSEHFGAGPNLSCPVQGDMCRPRRQRRLVPFRSK